MTTAITRFIAGLRVVLITQQSGNEKMKLNYRHSLATMRKEMAKFNETFLHTMEAGKDSFAVNELCQETGKLTQACGHFYSCSDIAEYINGRNNQT